MLFDLTICGAELEAALNSARPAVLSRLRFVVFCLFFLQSELVDLAESIQQKLSYFNELENINTVGRTVFHSFFFVSTL